MSTVGGGGKKNANQLAKSHCEKKALTKRSRSHINPVRGGGVRGDKNGI